MGKEATRSSQSRRHPDARISIATWLMMDPDTREEPVKRPWPQQRTPRQSTTAPLADPASSTQRKSRTSPEPVESKHADQSASSSSPGGTIDILTKRLEKACLDPRHDDREIDALVETMRHTQVSEPEHGADVDVLVEVMINAGFNDDKIIGIVNALAGRFEQSCIDDCKSSQNV